MKLNDKQKTRLSNQLRRVNQSLQTTTFVELKHWLN